MITIRENPELLDPARYPQRQEIPTRFADLDHNDHVNNVAIAAIIEDARMRSGYADSATYVASNTIPMMIAQNVEFLGQALYPKSVTVHMGLIDIGRSSWRAAALAVQEGRPVAFAVGVMVMTDGDKSIPIPDDVRILLEPTMLRLG